MIAIKKSLKRHINLKEFRVEDLTMWNLATDTPDTKLGFSSAELWWLITQGYGEGESLPTPWWVSLSARFLCCLWNGVHFLHIVFPKFPRAYIICIYAICIYVHHWRRWIKCMLWISFIQGGKNARTHIHVYVKPNELNDNFNHFVAFPQALLAIT